MIKALNRAIDKKKKQANAWEEQLCCILIEKKMPIIWLSSLADWLILNNFEQIQNKLQVLWWW